MKLLHLVVILGSIAGLSYMLFAYHASGQKLSYAGKAVYTFDSVFSLQYKRQIKARLNQEYAQDVLYGVAALLEREFPFIRTVHIDAQNLEEISFAIQSYKPLFVLNNRYVVCDNGMLAKTEWVCEKIQKKLVHVQYPHFQASGLYMDEDLVQKIAQVCQEYGKAYDIWWHDAYTVVLQDKILSEVRIVIRPQQIMDSDQLQHCKKVYQDIALQKQNKKMGGKPTWMCDIRFANQVVVFPAK